jgi:RNA polymerase sigma-70 factor (ECF subfamily)
MPRASLGADEFQQAFADHGRTLWVLAAAWVGRGDAHDLVQETARIAWQRRAGFAPGSDLRAWLSQIARHIGANWRRRRVAIVVDDLSERTAAAVPPTPWPFDADRCGLGDEVARALDGLPEAGRACLLLHVILDHTFAEISTMLDIPDNTVASHVRRARATLREALAPQRDHEPARDVR